MLAAGEFSGCSFMTMKRILFLLIIFIFVCSCDFSLYQVNDGIYKPETIDEDLSGKISGYEAVKLEELRLEGKTTYDVSSISDIDLVNLLISDFQELINGGYFEHVLSGLGLSSEEFFDPSHLKPRSLQALLELHARNEGIFVKNGYSYLYDVNLEHLDLIASVGFADALKFIFNYASDDYDYVGSQIKADGSVDISFSAYAKGEGVPNAASSGILSVYGDEVQFSIMRMKVNGKDIVLMIPSRGGLKFSGHFSLGKSHVCFVQPSGGAVAGFPALEEQAPVYCKEYLPYRIWVDIKETSLADCSKLYTEIRKMMSLSGPVITEASYQKIRSILWPESTGSEIVLGINFDDGRSIVLKDWELLQFLFAN